MKDIFEIAVNEEYMLSSDQETNLNDFLGLYFSIIVDEAEERYGSEIAKVVARKLFTQDYTIELDCDGEVQYTTVSINTEAA